MLGRTVRPRPFLKLRVDCMIRNNPTISVESMFAPPISPFLRDGPAQDRLVILQGRLDYQLISVPAIPSIALAKTTSDLDLKLIPGVCCPVRLSECSWRLTL